MQKVRQAMMNVQSGRGGVAALLCQEGHHEWRVICPPPNAAHQAQLAREGFTAGEVAAVGALVECKHCPARGWLTRGGRRG
jgi:hypothetical protein